jgi:hypothetical protein
VATSPELAVLGLSAQGLTELRHTSIGTAITNAASLPYSDAWGPCCATFLQRLAMHKSKASGSYYLRGHLQYFESVYSSLQELDRVLIGGSPCVLVVQDSQYKDIHNDLARISTEMADGLGWSLDNRHDYRVDTLMARVHPGRARYGGRTNARESVLWFTTSMRLQSKDQGHDRILVTPFDETRSYGNQEMGQEAIGVSGSVGW